ncbi:MAG: T9SS type A sorting domain-containing protein [Ignavibacteriales bacterium]|nr:T9SS type A sorting domain-containing protein [Ignavibacteriales bacterium]
MNGLSFKWRKAQERIEAIQKYQIQISIDSLFGSFFINDSTLTDTSKVVGGMSYLTKYFWRVRAQNQTGWGDWSETWRFTTIIEKPTIPVLASPLNNSLGLLNPITTKWNKSLRVEKYKLQVSTDSLFGSLIVNDSTIVDTTKMLPELANYTKYFWRVKAVNIGGESDWSTVWNFKTLGNPYSVILASPENGAVNNPVNSVTFKWFKPQERVETILKYHFQLSTDSLFGSIAFSDSTLIDTTASGSGLSYLTTYFWRVRAKNETGWGDWSQVWNLTTIIDKPSIPLLVSPANNVTQLLQPVVLKWRQSLRVEKYTLEVSENPNFTTLFLVDSTLTDTMRTLPQLQNAKTWYWRVKARNIGGSSEYSAVWNFRTLGLPLTVNLITPSNGSENLPVNDVLLQWSNSGEQTLGSVTSAAKSIKRAINDEESVVLTDGISTLEGGNHFASGNANPSSGVESIGKYWLEIKTDTSNLALFYSDSTLTDTTRMMSGFVYQTTYFWRVKANNEVGWGSFSGWFSFTTQTKPISTPTELTATATVVKQVTLSWNDNSDNELGFIILRKTGDSTSTALLEKIDSVGADVTGFIDTTVTDTTYYSYKVMAFNADTLSEQSNYATVFTLTGIKEFSSDIPKEFSLYQNYPNPFNPSTIIRFALPKDAHVEIELYSIQGELLNKLVSEDKQAGYYEISLEIPSYASGIYFYRIVATPGDRGEPFIQTRKFILMK